MFSFIAKNRVIRCLALICAALRLSRDILYALVGRAPSNRYRGYLEIRRLVGQSFLSSDSAYGGRRVWQEQLTPGIDYGLHAVERLRRLNALGDHAAIASFFSPLSTGRTAIKPYRSRAAAEACAFDHIGRFNWRRYHAALGYLSPMELKQNAPIA